MADEEEAWYMEVLGDMAKESSLEIARRYLTHVRHRPRNDDAFEDLVLELARVIQLKVEESRRAALKMAADLDSTNNFLARQVEYFRRQVTS